MIEMSLENKIKNLKRIQKSMSTWTDDKIIGEAIKSMEKLQKIEQIIKDHDNDNMPEDYWYIDKIREVIKNEVYSHD